MNTAADILRALDRQLTLEDLHALDADDLRRFEGLMHHWHQLAELAIRERQRIAEKARRNTAA